MAHREKILDLRMRSLTTKRLKDDIDNGSSVTVIVTVTTVTVIISVTVTVNLAQLKKHKVHLCTVRICKNFVLF